MNLLLPTVPLCENLIAHGGTEAQFGHCNL